MSVLYDQPVDTPKRSIAETVMNAVSEKDVASAIAKYRELKAGKTASEYNFAETGVEPARLSTPANEKGHRGDRNLQAERRDVSTVCQCVRQPG
jgi:hypothetical protein